MLITYPNLSHQNNNPSKMIILGIYVLGCILDGFLLGMGGGFRLGERRGNQVGRRVRWIGGRMWGGRRWGGKCCRVVMGLLVGLGSLALMDFTLFILVF
jgi:hypothetical protein